MGEEARVKLYLQELEHVRENQPDLLDAISYDAIFVDEGQDFLEDDFLLLKQLCRTSKEVESRTFTSSTMMPRTTWGDGDPTGNRWVSTLWVP